MFSYRFTDLRDDLPPLFFTFVLDNFADCLSTDHSGFMFRNKIFEFLAHGLATPL